MLFNSYLFLFAFFPIIFSLYFSLNKRKLYEHAKIILLIGSLFFYGYYNWYYLLIIMISIIMNFFCCRAIIYFDKNLELRKVVLLAGLCFNIGILLYFKYFNFFLENINYIFKTTYKLYAITLPLGISFFTFQQVAYIVDGYNRKVPQYSFLDYALYVTFFPQLIAGPIVLHTETVWQFNDISRKQIDICNIEKGIVAFTYGLFKKVAIADIFGLIVDAGYGSILRLTMLDAIIVIIAYALQIYFDFSGYSDMAIGLAKTFNIDIAKNFDSPYRAKSIDEFWKRWHITLTRFFTQYVYIPLGGNRKGKVRQYVNIIIVFLISGLWHGAGWNFVLWGGIHGIGQVLNRKFIKKWETVFAPLKQLITFIFICIAWVFFRASSICEACLLINRLAFKQIFISETIKCSLNDLLEIKVLTNTFYWVDIRGFVIVIFTIIGLLLSTMHKNAGEKVQGELSNFCLYFEIPVMLIWSILSLNRLSTFLYFGF